MCACSHPLPGSPLAYASHQPAQNAIASRVAKSTSADFPDPDFWGVHEIGPSTMAMYIFPRVLESRNCPVLDRGAVQLREPSLPNPFPNKPFADSAGPFLSR